MKLIRQIAAEYTKAGQAVQSARLLKQAAPEGRLYYIKRSVDNLQSELNGKRGSKSPKIKIDESLAQDVLNAQNDTELDTVADALMKSVARQIPGTWADKANAWRYTYTVDWSAPASLPLFMGVEMWNAMHSEDSGSTAFASVFKAMQNITEPVLNLTMVTCDCSIVYPICRGSSSSPIMTMTILRDI